MARGARSGRRRSPPRTPPSPTDVTRTPTLQAARDRRDAGRARSRSRPRTCSRPGSFKARGVSVKLASLGAECATRRGRRHRRATTAARWPGRRSGAGFPASCSSPRTPRSRRPSPPPGWAPGLTRCKGTVDDCVALAQGAGRGRRADAFVHPFDDPEVVAGPGRDRPRAAARTSPTWPRCWCRSAEAASRAGSRSPSSPQRPEVEVVGVQVEACAPYPASLEKGEPVTVEPAATVADGIAVKRPGVS